MIAKPFAASKFTVTLDEWDACIAGGGCASNKTPSHQGWGKGNRPVINVSWNDAKEYAAWQSKKTGKTYQLLSDLEWEYSARAGTVTAYSWNNDIIGTNSANCDGCGSKWDNTQTAPVGSFRPNAFGLYDMHGNVWQWCEDAYDKTSRVLRGGSWNSYPPVLRSAHRDKTHPELLDKNIGFRVARTLSP